MSKFKVQINSKIQMSNIFSFELWHSFEICLPTEASAQAGILKFGIASNFI